MASQIIAFEEAVADIIRATSENTPDRYPFFFVAGAGVSAPSIKLASEITRECRDKYEADRALYGFPEVSPKNTDPINEYSFWFEKAYSEPKLRARYLESIMREKPISPATLRLAHLLSSRKLATMVVTPNFDDFLHRALILIDEPPIICDHPATTSRIDPELTGEIQIIHTHGTWRFYDCCNLRGEIEERTEDRATNSSMSALLSQLLARRSPIVLGYSGWEDDVIMQALSRRLSDRPAFNFYWFCHTKAAHEALPAWLKASEYVRFVILNESATAFNASGADDEEEAQAKSSSPVTRAHYGALDVVERFTQLLRLDAPLITENPFEYLRVRLKALATQSSTSEAGNLYNFDSVIDRLSQAEELLKKGAAPSKQVLEEIENLIRASQYADACKLASGRAEANAIDDRDINRFMRLYHDAIYSLSRSSPQDAAQYSLDLLNYYNRLDLAQNENIAYLNAILLAAKAHARAHAHTKAIDLTDQIISHTDRNESEDAVAVRQEAIYVKATQLHDIDKNPEAIDLLKSLIELPIKDASLERHSHLYLARTLYETKRYGESFVFFKAIVSRFADAFAGEHLLEAYVFGSRSALRASENEEALAFVEEGIRKFEGIQDEEGALETLRLYVTRGVILEKLGKTAEALDSYLVVADLPLDDRNKVSRTAGVDSLLFCARIYGGKGEKARAIEYYNRLLTDYGQSDDPIIQSHVLRGKKELRRLQRLGKRD